MRSVRRRRLEKKTDYKSRLSLLKGNTLRLVARKTNRYIIVQIVESRQAQDKVVIGITSKKLLEKGWAKNNQGSLKNITAAYLTGYLIGKSALEKNIKLAIFDMGMHRNVHKSRLYAVLKGAIDAGLKIPHNSEALPSDEEINKNEKFKATLTKIARA